MLAATVFKLIWLRSGITEDAYFSYYMTSSGHWYNAYGARRLAVRPALYTKEALRYNVCGDGFLSYWAAFRRLRPWLAMSNCGCGVLGLPLSCKPSSCAACALHEGSIAL